ncbi:hypothetical protein LSCM1_06016 [Leishmania martiniquensis]|uniref:Uncharacterized protein n=1 Tax=Leishmania martiniquensis TaxID=1580590 RepID=A0A836KUF8_9TRYP|nr:hypothetical protein LSCM1_06016 [Leishmania martiniquensis]
MRIRLPCLHHIEVGGGPVGSLHRSFSSPRLQTGAGVSRPTRAFSCTQTFTTPVAVTISVAWDTPRAAFCTPARLFGSAPSRVRPVEAPSENARRQNDREVSASVITVIMLIVPLWLYVLGAHGQERKRAAVRAWALEQRAADGTTRSEADDKP